MYMYIYIYVYIYIHTYISIIYISCHKRSTTHRELKTHRSKMGVIFIQIMKTMCPSGYHRNGFVATHAHGHMIVVGAYLSRKKKGGLYNTYHELRGMDN